MLALVPVLAAGGAPAFFTEVAILLVSSAVVAYVCYRFGLLPIVGFLLTGVLIGPNALGLIQDQELIDAAAEIGVILLLFTIGIEFSLEKLARIKRLIFLGGGLQVGITVAAVTGLLLLFGVELNAGIYTGCLVALSSTAIVLKLLGDRGETETTVGQIGLGLLIFQDLAVIVMVLLVPILGGGGGSLDDLALALGKAAGIIVLVLVVARRVMPKILEAVARTCSPELFLLSVIAICFGTAFLTSLAGVSLSLGAFLAGLVVSESRFSEHAFGEILPLQILFSAAFFVSVGLLLDVQVLIANLGWVLAAIGGVLLLKVLITTFSVRALGYSMPAALCSALYLGQVGEFSFVLERAGNEAGLLAGGMEAGPATFIAATVVLMVVTPFLAQLGRKLEACLNARTDARESSAMAAGGDGAADEEPFESVRDHVIIAGYGTAGQKLAYSLREADVPFVILTLNPGGANDAERDEMPVLRGDYARQHTLRLAGIDRAKVLVVADDDPSMAQRVVAVTRMLRPDVRIVARTRFEAEVHELAEGGADHVISEEQESHVRLLDEVLETYDMEHHERMRYMTALRETRAEGPRSGNGRPGTPLTARTMELSEKEKQSRKCSHQDQTSEVTPGTNGCKECLEMGDTWVHLRVCLSCGHVGCCDSSKNKHARKHHGETGHPIVKSGEPGEDWSWCFEDKKML
ncbi:MAG: cation:proton antiporter [Rhodothermales bacterium]